MTTFDPIADLLAAQQRIAELLPWPAEIRVTSTFLAALKALAVDSTTGAAAADTLTPNLTAHLYGIPLTVDDTVPAVPGWIADYPDEDPT